MLKAPLLGFSGLVSVSMPGKEVVKKSRYSFAILLNFCQEVQCSMETLTSFLLPEAASSALALLFLLGGPAASPLEASSGVSSSALLFLDTFPFAMFSRYFSGLLIVLLITC